MQHPQELRARSLHDRLARRLDSIGAQTLITVSGSSSDWTCSARRGQKSCRVQCFDYCGPEFFARFEDQEKEVAIGRTTSQAEVTRALWHWLEGLWLGALCCRFSFIDRSSHELQRIRDFMLQYFPELAVAAVFDRALMGPNQSPLRYWSETRRVELFCNRQNQFPDAVFYWDQAELFRFTVHEYPTLGMAMKCWLTDDVPPSAMRKEFPWLTIARLADNYEQGRALEGDFLESWDRIEKYYGSIKQFCHPRYHWLIGVALPFIAQLRRAGYDRNLRAGQSLFSLVVTFPPSWNALGTAVGGL